MRRAQQQSYCKPSVDWHSKNRQESELAASIRVVELPEDSSERAFEAEVRRLSIEEQKHLEADPTKRKPSILSVVETIPFVGGETFEQWLAKQPKDVIEEFEAAQFLIGEKYDRSNSLEKI